MKRKRFHDKSPTVFQVCNMLPFLDSRYTFCRRKFGYCHVLRTPNEAFFHGKPKLQGLGRKFGQINFFVIWGIFCQSISTHFGTMSPLSMFSINQPLFLKKEKAFISKSQSFILDWDLNLILILGRKELGIQPSCVRSP